MIDGKRYKMLRRHLSQNGYTPESYREAFDLPKDYPMVAASYAETRRDLAKKIGLGRKPRSPKEQAATPAKKAQRQEAKSTSGRITKPYPQRQSLSVLAAPLK
jgi:predicted transcriptional regulator